jgi:hypothetical protein
MQMPDGVLKSSSVNRGGKIRRVCHLLWKIAEKTLAFVALNIYKENKNETLLFAVSIAGSFYGVRGIASGKRRVIF